MFAEEDIFSSTPCSSPDMNSGDDLSDSSTNIPSSLINAENYITFKEGCQSAFTPEELTIAVNKCKKLVLETEECTGERKWLVRRLIELRHRLEQAKEIKERKLAEKCEDSNLVENREENKLVEEVEESFVKLGHHFKMEYLPTSTSKKYCDGCCRTIWNVIQSYYQCIDCQYKCHLECVETLHRVCSHLIMSEKPNYESQICPEVGLDSQGYRCYECKAKISYNIPKGYYTFSSGENALQARRCDYNGHHYCPSCHWNTLSVIPARIMLNWDFEPQRVCRASYQLLRLTKSRPLITLDERLYAFVQDLALIRKMRTELGLMKQYIATCRLSFESGLLMRELEWRRHLVHSTTTYSLDDLCDIYNGIFLAKIEAVHNVLRTHIKEECDVCKGRGYICELCESSEVIYGFDSNTYTCPKCENVTHKFCWTKHQSCKKCLRKEQKVEIED